MIFILLIFNEWSLESKLCEGHERWLLIAHRKSHCPNHDINPTRLRENNPWCYRVTRVLAKVQTASPTIHVLIRIFFRLVNLYAKFCLDLTYKHETEANWNRISRWCSKLLRIYNNFNFVGKSMKGFYGDFMKKTLILYDRPQNPKLGKCFPITWRHKAHPESNDERMMKILSRKKKFLFSSNFSQKFRWWRDAAMTHFTIVNCNLFRHVNTSEDFENILISHKLFSSSSSSLWSLKWKPLDVLKHQSQKI